MLRRLLAAGLVLAVVAGCGSGDASPSAEPSSATTTAPVVQPTEPPSEAPSDVPSAGTIMTTECAAVGLRKAPKTSAAVLGRIAADTPVNVVETVTGAKYQAGSCGTSGKEWLKIDFVDGVAVEDAYGVEFAYAAAGFFK